MAISSNIVTVTSTPSPIFVATKKNTQVIVKGRENGSGNGFVLGGPDVSLTTGFEMLHTSESLPSLTLNPGDVLYARSDNQDPSEICLLVVE